MVLPSCPALVIHDDDAFRKALIAMLDQKHFTVTVSADGINAIDQLKSRPFHVILLGVDLTRQRGMESLQYLREHREAINSAVIILGEPNPELRNVGKVADETLLKPVDVNYVTDRARTYCRH